MKKRPLIIPTIAGILAAAVSLLLLRMSLIPSLLVVLGVWLGTYLLGSDDKNSSPAQLVRELTLEEQLAEIDKNIKKMEQYENRLEDPTVIKHVNSITKNLKKIVNATKEDTSRYTKNHKVFEQYIPLTLKILEDYDNIENQKLTSKSSREYMTKVKENIALLDRAYSSVLNNLYETDIMESSADITTLNSLLSMEGLSNENR